VIATGFDRAGAMRSPSATASQTPVDLHDYTARLRGSGQSIDVATASKAAFARRPSLELPTALAVGAEGQALRDEGASAFDVPAFLRRQSE
jgi:hypothetical protein